MHKKMRLVQGPNSFFMDVKCKGKSVMALDKMCNYLGLI
jgi:hypothetical protein